MASPVYQKFNSLMSAKKVQGFAVFPGVFIFHFPSWSFQKSIGIDGKGGIELDDR